MKLRVACLQAPHEDDLDVNLATARRLIEAARGEGAELALLPEYFFMGRPEAAGTLARAEAKVRDLLARASRALDMAVAGNAVVPRDGGHVNEALVYDRGQLVGRQAKIHPMPREAAAGVGRGTRLDPFPLRGVPSGVLVCADILYPEASRVLALKGSELLLNPVMSPYREEDDTKAAREAIYVARAWDAGAFVLKAGGFRRKEPRVAGRSLVAAPWGLLARYRDDLAEEILVADLDFERLRAFRRDQARFPGRVPQAYRELVEDLATRPDPADG